MSLLAFLALAAPARAADPIMPLSEVRSGMRCTSLSVIKGVDPVSFDVRVEDVVEGGPTADSPRILVSVSGAAVDATGIGPGFSGSPIYCRNAQGQDANIGAISESIGEYGGKVALATPIETILGNPPDAPEQTVSKPGATRRARSLVGPLTVSGLSAPLAAAINREAAKRGSRLVATPAGPLKSFPPQTLRPGSAMGVGYSSGDVALGAVGTVAYVDGDRVWSFGHELDGVGRRNLLLQDAYVYKVISNPNATPDFGTTYKLAAPSHDVGTLSNDALSAVVGRTGILPRTTPIHVTVHDEDTDARESVNANVADETDVGDPLGTSLPALVAPLAVLQGAGTILKSVPARLSGDACTQITVSELGAKPLRFCNRYVSDASSGGGFLFGLGNVVALGAGTDAEAALSLIGGFTSRALHVTEVSTGVRLRRGSELAFLRDLELPDRAKAGETVTAKLTVQRFRGPKQIRRVPLKLPSDLDRGSRRIILRGTDADFGGDLFFDSFFDFGNPESGASRDESALDQGPQSLSQLRKAITGLGRFDGVRLFVGRERGEGKEAFVDSDVRLSGRVSDRIRITR